MKKMMFAFVCSLGVGLAMMASPAQVCDDNNANGGQGGNSVHSVIGKPVSHGRIFIKHEWKMKKIDFSKVNAPRRMGSREEIINLGDVVLSSLDSTDIIFIDIFKLKNGIISDPTPSGPTPVHGNGFNPNNNDQLMVSGHSNTRPQSARPNLDEAGNHTLINIITGDRDKGNGVKIINDPIIVDPGHQNMPDPIDPKRVDR